MINALKNLLFPGKITTRPELPFSQDEMQFYINRNRLSLKKVEDWVDEKAFAASCFSYGVPDFIKAVINREIDNTPTYTDYICAITHKHLPSINYLEIGVSVGKNFFQLLEAHQQGRFTAFDIEEINPVLARTLSPESREEWATPAKSIKKTNSSLSRYKYGTNEVAYLCADVWDENSWAKLKGNKFNLVFSDALHTPQAILFEFEMLVKYDLLDSRFVIVWDDLVGKMKNSFFKIIRKYDRVYSIQDIYFLNVNGWVGQHEAPHSVGIISNFSI